MSASRSSAVAVTGKTLWEHEFKDFISDVVYDGSLRTQLLHRTAGRVLLPEAQTGTGHHDRNHDGGVRPLADKG